MSKCKIEFEDLNAWKTWFDTGNKDELVKALELMERSVHRTLSSGNGYAKAREPFIEYAKKKLDERFDDWMEDYVPF